MKKLTYLLIFLTFSQNSFSAENSLYEFKWLDEGGKVYVIQNKEHIKSGRFAIDFSVMDSNSSPYQSTTGLNLALVYFFNENWSIDFTYKSYTNSDSGDLTNLLTAYATQTKPLIRRIDSAKLVHINWIPFYGKINTFNKIFFFDWGVGLGAGQFDTAGNYETFAQTNISLTYKDEVDTGFNLRTFVKFYAGDNMTLGLEYNLAGVNTILSQDATKEILFYNDLTASIGYMF